MLIKNIRICRVYLILLFVFVCTLIYTAKSAQGDEIVLIFNGPSEEIYGTPQIPFETRLYIYNENNNSLNQIWSMGKNVEANKVGVYRNGNIFIASDKKELQIFDLGNHDKLASIIPGGYLGDFHYFELKNDTDIVEIRTLNRDDKGNANIQFGNYTIFGSKSSCDLSNKSFGGIIRVTGSRAIGINESDGVQLGNILRKNLTTGDTKYVFQINTLPDSLTSYVSSRSWVLVANEPSFCALIARPLPNNKDVRHFIIYNRIDKTWNSIEVPGMTTTLRLINGLLVGRIEALDPNSEPERGYFFSPILTDEVVIIDPVNNTYTTIKLELSKVILWIENNVIYYRNNDSFYKAVLENGQLLNCQLLISNPAIKSIRMAVKRRNILKQGKMLDN